MVKVEYGPYVEKKWILLCFFRSFTGHEAQPHTLFLPALRKNR